VRRWRWQTRQQQSMQTELVQLRQAATDARRLVIFLAISALLCGAVLAWVFARRIVGSVQEAVSVAETIAGGDYRKEVPTGKRDEIGGVAARAGHHARQHQPARRKSPQPSACGRSHQSQIHVSGEHEPRDSAPR